MSIVIFLKKWNLKSIDSDFYKFIMLVFFFFFFFAEFATYKSDFLGNRKIIYSQKTRRRFC